MRVTLVTNIPAPYRLPLFRAVDERLRALGGGLSIVYGGLTQSDRQWLGVGGELEGIRTIVMRRAQLTLRGRSTYVNPGVVRHIARTRPDAVVLGGFAPWAYPIAAWCRAHRLPLSIWSGETHSSAAAHGIRPWPRFPLVRAAAGMLAYGPRAAEYLEDALHVPRDRITVVGNGIEVDAFQRLVDEAREQPPLPELRDVELPIVLSVGGKGIEIVRDALPRMARPVQLVVAGTPSSPPGAVHLGKRPAAEMPAIYARATCLVHLPVYDRWAHAINESLSAGVPVVVSPDNGLPDDVFAAPGCAIVPREAAPVAEALDRAVQACEGASPGRREEVRARLRPWGVPGMADRFVSGVRSAADAST